MMEFVRMGLNVKVGDRLIVLRGKHVGEYGEYQALTVDGRLMVTLEDGTPVVLNPFDVELADFLPAIRRIDD